MRGSVLGRRPILAAMSTQGVHATHLYGAYNSTHQTWIDGVLTAALRQACGRQAGGRSWLVLDGPVDSVWVEALNPVLDDNRWVWPRCRCCNAAPSFRCIIPPAWAAYTALGPRVAWRGRLRVCCSLVG